MAINQMKMYYTHQIRCKSILQKMQETGKKKKGEKK